MSCEEVMVSSVILVTEDKTVADAMQIFEQYSIRGVPVVDSENRLVGLFSIQHLLRFLLPEAAVLKNMPRLKSVDVSLSQLHMGMPRVANRLKSLKTRKISEVMIKPDVVEADMPMQEGIRLLEKYSSPIPVVDDMKTMKLLGVITSQSVIRKLNAMREAN